MRAGTLTSDRLALAVACAVIAHAGRVSAEPPCRLVAQVSGDPAVVPWVVERLLERRIPVTGASSCGALSAVLSSEDDGRVRVSIRLDDGRSVERVVDDVEGAATSIESWSRRDVSDPLLAAHPTGSTALAAAAPASARGIEVAAAAAASVTGDGAVWAGAQAHGCVRIGALCLGALVAYARDSERRGDSAELDTSRSALDLMLVADLPLARGRFTLAPGVAVGQRSLEVERDAPSEDSDRVNGLLVRAHASAGYRFAGSWSLAVDLGVGYMPTGEERLLDDEGIEPPLAGAPPGQMWLALGLAYGGL